MPGSVSAVALAIAGIGAAAGTAATRPIRLEVQSSGGANIVQVIADGQLSCKATYQLEVSGNGGGNQSVNSGTVTLPTKGPVAVATVRVGDSNSSATVALLTVKPCGGQPYEQVWKSPGMPPRG